MISLRPQDLNVANWLPAGIGLDDAIAGLAALAVLTMLAATWHALRPKNAFERRLEQVVERKETLRRQALSARTRRQHRRPIGWMRAAVTSLNLLRSRHAAEARQRLARAGIRSPDAMIGYLFARLSLPSLFGCAALLDSSVLRMLPLPPDLRFMPAIAAALLGFYAPNIYLKNVAAKRAKQLQLALPDGLDLMVICAEAGLSLDATLLRVARELARQLARTRRGVCANRRRTDLYARPPVGVRKSQQPDRFGCNSIVGQHLAADRKIRHPSGAFIANIGERVAGGAHDPG